MAINLSPGKINEIYTVINGAMQQNYDEVFDIKNAANNLRDLTMEMDTDQDSVKLPYIESVVGLSQGLRNEPVNVRSVLGGQHEIFVDKYEDGFEVSKHDVVGDRLGLYIARAQDLGAGAALLRRDLILRALRLGDSSAYPMHDAQNYFANAHPKGGTTFDNLQTGVFNAANLQALRVAMMRFPSDAGALRPLGIAPTHLVCPPDIAKDALELVHNTFVPGGAGEGDNFFKGLFKVIEAPELTDTNDWYLIWAGGKVKPFIHLSKTGFSPFKIDIEGDVPGTSAYKHEKLIFTGFTYEMDYPSRPEYAIKSVN